jgi:uncharacterized protein YndB with AHSA1/START domain
MSEPTAQVSNEIHATPHEVWKALTTPSLLKRYFMGADVESDFKVGSPITFRGNFKGKSYQDKGEIKAATQDKRLEFSHFSPLSGQPDQPENYHLVSIDLSPSEDATRVTLTQSNLQGGPKASDAKMRAEFEKNWMAVLAGLKKVVEEH